MVRRNRVVNRMREKEEHFASNKGKDFFWDSAKAGSKQLFLICDDRETL